MAMPPCVSEAFDTRAAYLQAIDNVISVARRDVCVFDLDLKNLGFDKRSRADSIAAFLAGGRDRKLRMVLHDIDHLTRYSPRIMVLLKRYSHSFSVRRTPESLRSLGDCFVLADGTSGVIRFHVDHFRGKTLIDQALEVHDWQQRFEDLWLESIPGVTATHLGL
jgi:hypothetical protein